MKIKSRLRSIRFHLTTGALGLLMVYPLLWLLASSFKSNETMFINPYSLIPESWAAAENYQSALGGVAGVPFSTFLGNTVLVTVIGGAGCVLVSLLASYAFARIRFRFANFIFGCVLVTMMIPAQIMVVPQYIVLKWLNLIDKRIALILPWFFGGAFFIFLLTQFFRGIPMDMDEAAEIDGCSRIGTLFRVLVPIVMPAIITSSIFAFYWIWQDFFQPLIFMNTPKKFTITLALNLYLDPNSYNNYGGLFAMSVLSLIPILVFFIIFQKHLAEGIAMDGVKG